MEWKIQAQELFNSIKVWLAPETGLGKNFPPTLN